MTISKIEQRNNTEFVSATLRNLARDISPTDASIKLSMVQREAEGKKSYFIIIETHRREDR